MLVGIVWNGHTSFLQGLSIGPHHLANLLGAELPLKHAMVTRFIGVHDGVKDITLYIKGHAPGLKEASIAIPGEPRLTSFLDESFNNLLVNSHIQEGNHHSRHRYGSTTTHRQEQWSGGRAENSSGGCFKVGLLLIHSVQEVLVGGTVIAADLLATKKLSGHDKTGWYRNTLICQEYKVVPLVAQVYKIVGRRIQLVNGRDRLVGIIAH